MMSTLFPDQEKNPAREKSRVIVSIFFEDYSCAEEECEQTESKINFELCGCVLSLYTDIIRSVKLNGLPSYIRSYFSTEYCLILFLLDLL